MAWATTEEAGTFVGAAISQEELDTAQGVIDIFSRVPWAEDISSYELRSSDISWLKRAVSYQAKWMADQIDVLNRTDVDNVTQDGMSFKNAHPDAQLLAPLAKRALDNVSWRRNKTVIPRPSRGTYRNGTPIAIDDDCWNWRRM